MNAQELRIGNYIHLLDENSFCGNEVEEYQIDWELMMYLCQQESIAHFAPIPITPEWLEKLGFELSDKDVYWSQYTLQNWGMQLIFFNSEYIVRHGFMGDYTEITHLKYIHLLQNLYFALTGKELVNSKT